jgi:hypothetical protein
MTPDPWCTAARHGDERIDYRRGCRCTVARKAEAAYTAMKRNQRIMGFPGAVDATGVRRRLQALGAIGWPSPELAVKLGTTKQAVEQLRHRQTVVFRTTADRITALYNELSMRPGPSAESRKRARLLGWPPPLAWDDDSLDDPRSCPVGWIPQSRRTIPLDDVELLAHCGETWDSTATRLGSSRNSIERALHRHGRLDVAHRLSANSETWNLTENRNQWSA